MRLIFLGANRQVTGSSYVLEVDTPTAHGLRTRRVMIDHGLFQERPFQHRNWDPCPIPAAQIDAVLLTHAHLDHCGRLPKLVREGFRGPIFTTRPTVQLTKIILRDAAEIQQEDAAYKARRHQREGRNGTHPELPLYTTEDVDHTLPLLHGLDYNAPRVINDHFTATWIDAGHILGSAMIAVDVRENGRSRRVVFSGDIGHTGKPFTEDPSAIAGADWLVAESTYGDRDHPANLDVERQLADVIGRTVARGGKVVIPTFALERAQELVYHFGRLSRAGVLPTDLPVYLDSPMAVDITDVFLQFRDWWDEPTRAMFESGLPPLHFPQLRLVRSVAESKAINEVRGPAIIMASSGMCSGGRIKHHLARRIGIAQNTILFVGYQSVGTLGRRILDGDSPVRILGVDYMVNAEVASIAGLSAHADRKGLLDWFARFQSPPTRTYLTHGEESASLALADKLTAATGWAVEVPQYQQTAELA